MDPADAQLPRARGDHRPGVRVRRRAEDRRAGDLADLPRRRVRARRDPRQRRGRRGRHPQPADDPGDPAAARHGRSARAGRGPRRGLHVAAGLRQAQRAPRRGGALDVHEPAQLRRRARSASSTRSSPPIGRCRCGATGSGPPRGSRSTPTGMRSSGCARTASRSTPTSRSCRPRTRSWRSAARGRSGAARSTSRSTASSSRSTSSSSSAGSGRSDASRGGRSRGSSRPPPRSRQLKQIGWNPGKFGDLHPYAMLEPVHVGGVTVKLATLHNEEDLARKDIREGEEVIVLRAGDVIPQVLSPAPHVAERTRPTRRRRARRSAARSATRRRSSPRTRSSPAARTATARAAAGSCSSTSSARWTSTGSARSR